MVVVTGREFRASQAKYLDYVAKGEDVILTSRRGSFRIVPVAHNDAVYNEERITEMIERSLKQISKGESYTMREDESAEQFLNRMIEEE